ncbi:MAG: hypothetical protein JSV40_04090, partial [Deltaproteobacteria bacterium]
MEGFNQIWPKMTQLPINSIVEEIFLPALHSNIGPPVMAYASNGISFSAFPLTYNAIPPILPFQQKVFLPFHTTQKDTLNLWVCLL